MKLNKFTNLLVLGLVLTVAAVGCRKRPDDLTRIPGNPPYANVQPPVSNPEPIITSTNAGSVESTNATGFPQQEPGRNNWPEDRQIFAADTIHFAFDSSVLRTDEKPKAAAVADYLKSHHGDAVRIEGHCDERGTAEYNRALGERRALALREELIRLGINLNDVETISYGFDRPVDPGHTEAAWSKNRRGEFILLTPPAKVLP
jgi:peptidoglycan-associated lipoprotein